MSRRYKRLPFGTKVQFRDSELTGFVLNAHHGFYQILIQNKVLNIRRTMFYPIHNPTQEQIVSLILVQMKLSDEHIIL